MAKPKRVRICKVRGCGLEAAPRLTRCIECWLVAQAPVVRAERAERRLSRVPEPYRRSRVPEREWPDGRRWCGGCQTMVRLVDCSGSRCKGCASRAAHASRVKAFMGIDGAAYAALLAVQGGRCAICRAKPKTTRLALDHDHGHAACGGKGCPECLRGLCCARCNKELLGAAHDSIHILRNAVAYLAHPPASGRWQLPAIEREPEPEERAPF